MHFTWTIKETANFFIVMETLQSITMIICGIFPAKALAKLVFNNKKMQSNFSNFCGLYSLFFLHQRFKGVSMNQIVNTFSAFNVYLNDSYIIQFISRTFGNCVKNECVYNQTCKPLVVK